MTDIQPVIATSEDIEVTERWQDGQRLLFVLNHTECKQNFVFDRRYISLFDRSILEGTISMAPYDILILRESRD
jgi:hypothetical protein